MAAYYNEICGFTAQWTRNLINAGLIAPGDVDERSIEDVTPDDIKSYTQCHFFAGFGTWSYALRLAGFPDDRRVWTASCPCTPFSTAGEERGFADERHLWPSLQWLIEQCRPAEVYGEQVANKTAEPWVDLVHADLEALGYAFACVPFASASVGAPHIRDRAYWVAHANDPRSQGRILGGSNPQWQDQHGHPGRSGTTVGLADPFGIGLDQRGSPIPPQERASPARDGGTFAGQPPAGEINSFWSNADWIHCRDNKWRPIEPGASALVDGSSPAVGRMQPRLEAMGFSPADIKRLLGQRNSTLAVAGRNRVGRLKAYGNAINAQQAKEFIQIAMRYQP